MRLFIITGGSRGLGLGLVQQSLLAGDQVISVARSAQDKAASLITIKHDIAEASKLFVKLDKALASLKLAKYSSIHLINNAAVLEPLGAFSSLDPLLIRQHLEINLTTPILLSQYFVKKFKTYKGWLTVTNISSGAAHFPIERWSMYCSAKAGLKMFTDCLNLENSDKKIKFINFSPGLMDTAMQTTIRKKKKTEFPGVDQFKNYQTDGQLASPEQIAGVLLQVLQSPEKIQKTDLNIKNGQLA